MRSVESRYHVLVLHNFLSAQSDPLIIRVSLDCIQLGQDYK